MAPSGPSPSPLKKDWSFQKIKGCPHGNTGGLVVVSYVQEDQKVKSVKLINVPSTSQLQV
jgi:hypothetical protein